MCSRPGLSYRPCTTELASRRRRRLLQRAVAQLQKAAERKGLFEPGGRVKSLKCLIDHPFTEDETNALVSCCESVRQEIREHAVPDGLAPG